jgi:hypothetical protein
MSVRAKTILKSKSFIVNATGNNQIKTRRTTMTIPKTSHKTTTMSGIEHHGFYHSY